MLRIPKLETLGSYLLAASVFLAILISNSTWNNAYITFFHTSITFQWTDFHFKSNLIFLINDGLMTIFFLVVGLEIKYDLLHGVLNSKRKALLPIIAGIGGMVMPALIYTVINYHNTKDLRGWAIPTATDIAFALGVLSMLGRRVPAALKTFLSTLAIFDDLAAIMIIALFYTEHISILYLGWSLFCILILTLCHYKKITHLFTYCVIGTALWFCFLGAGLNPTLAGVVLAFLIPLGKADNRDHSPLHTLKKKINPSVLLFILPLFAFANAGVPLAMLSVNNVHFPVLFGILLGLFLGKQLGVFSACWLAVKYKIAELPAAVQWLDMYGVAIICGVGFTISLFIGTLAFDEMNINHLNSVRVGVFGGSILSGCVGYLLLRMTHRRNKKHKN